MAVVFQDPAQRAPALQIVASALRSHAAPGEWSLVLARFNAMYANAEAAGRMSEVASLADTLLLLSADRGAGDAPKPHGKDMAKMTLTEFKELEGAKEAAPEVEVGSTSQCRGKASA